MIRFIVAALWICAATVGAVIYSFQAAGEAADQPPKPLLGGLDYVSTNMISVPLVRDAQVKGYFLTKLVYTVEPAARARLSVPAEALITDQVYSYLYANPQIDPAKETPIDLDAFRKNIRDSINARIGTKLVDDVMIDQINFLTADEIRDNAIRRRNARQTEAEARNQAAGQ
jgi:hypothetical protein